MLGIVAHDAGGAEILSSYIRRNNIECLFCLEGPAKKIFERKLGEIENRLLEDLLGNCDRLLCGTSILSDFEWTALKQARESNIWTVAVLDHWINYQQRFVRNEASCFPDEIWAGDEIAYRLVESEIPESAVKLVANAYFMDLADKFAEIPVGSRDGQGLRILFVCEPLRNEGLSLFGNERYWGHTEEEAMRYFLSNLQALSQKIHRITLRAHPRESHDKYDWASEEFDLPITTGEIKSLEEQIAESDVVVGGGTMAMVVGLIARKRVVCCLPPNSKVMRLPHKEVEAMSEFVKWLEDQEIVQGKS
ncbi:hypothetical protein [Kiloniella sp.]|uniref:hypothetical protein n=1 Tax=Kiloniella sp. TaxID=1938587 RepID=UPI003B0210F5